MPKVNTETWVNSDHNVVGIYVVCFLGHRVKKNYGFDFFSQPLFLLFLVQNIASNAFLDLVCCI